uniref:hepatitis A virus cellular receptor 1 homolog isoform X2 n=1 Tax=Scatophagus argus TaxID=75038 RepID=UPI001ED7EEAB|nr:hepatitis A virus cellular receptor 1 homolog isoform X2 [Scatophagus argus]
MNSQTVFRVWLTFYSGQSSRVHKCVCVSVRRQCSMTRLIAKLVMKLVLLLALLSVTECSSSRVVGVEGHSVTLACKYDIKYHNALSACWGRGHLPASRCGKPLISTEGLQVVDGSRLSSRYQLQGRLDEGDVSLTILNVTHSDAGRYGCRVEIPGLFNDDKQYVDLVIETAARTTAAAALSRPTSAPSPADTSAAGQVTSAVTLLASSSSSIEAEEEEDAVETLVLVCVLFGLVALVTAGGLVIITRRWRRLNKIPQQQQVNPSIHFSSTSSTLHLHSRSSAVENIYEIGGGGEGGEYERCP